MAQLPFSITEFTNRTGTISFRVQGYWEGRRIRKNFSDRTAAEVYCNDKNAGCVVPAAPSSWRVVQTTLTEAEVREVEACVTQLAGGRSLRDVLRLGIAAAKSERDALPVGTLAEQWLEMIELEVSARWGSDLRHRVRSFVRAHPGLTTDRFDRAAVRAWLDAMPHAPQTKANFRNALHRFGGWLVERGFVAENPAGEIRITRQVTGAQFSDRALPAILSPLQAEALLRACELGACRRLLGWVASCLFVGLRPDSEAPRATWSEVNLETGEWSVLGRKRGARVRVIPLTPTALAWLDVVKADKLERPALYSRRTKERAIELANGWLAENYPEEPRIAWSSDVTRHTFASYRSPQVPIHDLARDLGNSPATIYAHYRHPRPAAEVAAFWQIRPARSL